jgi:hypothetical protein
MRMPTGTAALSPKHPGPLLLGTSWRHHSANRLRVSELPGHEQWSLKEFHIQID